MPKVRRSRKPPPDGWELIEPTLEELEQKMREGKSRRFDIFNFTAGFILRRTYRVSQSKAQDVGVNPGGIS